MPTVAIYTRLSLDTGEQTATLRQEAACRSFAAARGWTVAQVFEDIDRSAYQRGVVRPAYEELRRAAAAAAFDGVVVWKLDRLVRRNAEFERFWTACETGEVFLASVTEPVDSSTAIGLAIVRVLVTFAGLESTSNGLRLQAKLREQAVAGAAPNGPRPFGFTDGWDAVVEPEAELIREAARRVLSGEGFADIAHDWGRRGIRGRRSAPWQGTHLRALLRNPRICGDRTWHGEVVARGCFPAIVDRFTFDRLQVVTQARARKHAPLQCTYLLKGLLQCGACGADLYGRQSRPPGYACHEVGCYHVCIKAVPTEELLVQQVFERLAQRWPVGRREPRRPRPDVLELHAARLRQLNHDFYVTRLLSRSEYLELRGVVTGEAMAETAAEPEWLGDGLPRTFRIRNAKVAWPVLTVPQRRAVLGSELDHAVISPAVRRGRPIYDAGRVVAVWRADT